MRHIQTRCVFSGHWPSADRTRCLMACRPTSYYNVSWFIDYSIISLFAKLLFPLCHDAIFSNLARDVACLLLTMALIVPLQKANYKEVYNFGQKTLNREPQGFKRPNLNHSFCTLRALFFHCKILKYFLDQEINDLNVKIAQI